MCSTHRPIIPPELLLKIFRILDGETLSTLLTVSHSVSELAAPLLYEDVGLLASRGSNEGPRFQSAMDHFSTLVSANGGRLGAWVKRLHLRIPFARQADHEWCRILPFCPNLRSLDLSISFDPYGPLDTPALYPLLSSLNLTHLSLESITSPASFKSLLESQYAIETLSIRHMADAGFSLSPDALPNLVSLSGPWSFLDVVIPGRNVVHLEIKEFSPAIDKDSLSPSMAQALDNIQSIYLFIDEDTQGLTRLPNLQNLKYVQIAYFPPLDLLQFLSQLSGAKLRYLQIASIGRPIDQDLNWTSFFKMFPSLRLLDVHSASEYDNPWYRYRFDDSDNRRKEVDLKYDVWQRWWHVVQQDVEDAVSQSSSGM